MFADFVEDTRENTVRKTPTFYRRLSDKQQHQGERKMTAEEMEHELVSFLKSCTSESARVLALREALLEYRECYRMAEREKAILQHTVWDTGKQVRALLDDNKAMVCRLENAERIQVQNAELKEEVLSLRKALQQQEEESQKVNHELQDEIRQLTDLNIKGMKMDWGDLMDQEEKDNDILTLKTANQALSEKNFELEKRLTEKQEEVISMKEPLPENHEATERTLSLEIRTLKSALHNQQKDAAEASKQLQDRDKTIEHLKTSAQLMMAQSNGHWSRRTAALKEQVSEKNNVCMDSQAQINQLQKQIRSLQDLLHNESEHVGVLQRQLLDKRHHLSRTVESHKKARKNAAKTTLPLYSPAS